MANVSEAVSEHDNDAKRAHGGPCVEAQTVAVDAPHRYYTELGAPMSAVVNLKEWKATHEPETQLNAEQRSAVALIRKLSKGKAARAGVTVIVAGPAGTGKTTLLEALEPIGVLIATPTGKAAVRVTEKTGLPASTIHRLIYDPRETLDGAVEFEAKA